MNFLQSTLLFLLITGTAFCGFKTYKLEQEKTILKNDLVEISNIKYGLFNVDEWKFLLAEIIHQKVETFDLEGSNKEKMRAKIQLFLNETINDLEKSYYKEKSTSISGLIQGGIATITGIFKQIKKDVPVFTEKILDFLNEKENREAIRNYLTGKLNEYADSTFSKADYTLMQEIIDKYGQNNKLKTKNHLQLSIQQLSQQAKIYQYGLIGIAIICFLYVLLVKQIKTFGLLLSLLVSLGYLILGIFLPMIEIDARIAEMNFHLLGEEITFIDQIIYYKSKSIIEVVYLMVTQKRIDIITVGVLVFTFSVLFPLFKLICSGFYIRNKNIRTNSLINFMVLKSGKWSMADVMVLAIFMAYIGFDGIISEQLKQLDLLSNNLDLFTTNQSKLNFGFYLFTLFVLLSLTISQKIHSNLVIK